MDHLLGRLLCFLCLCSSLRITAAAGRWKKVRTYNQTKVQCTKLNHPASPIHKPKYDSTYANVGLCQTACLTSVPQCNTVNYSPITTKHAKAGKCQFEYCQKGYKHGSAKGFDSYINAGPTGDPILPGIWIKVRDSTQEKVLCNKLNTEKGGTGPRYDTAYKSIDECKSACVTQVLGCNAVNFAPKAVEGTGKGGKGEIKFGKCQFEYCENNYKVGGSKHFDSYIFNGPVFKITTTTSTALWSLKRDVDKGKVTCEHLNTRARIVPRFGSKYPSLAACQAACAKEVIRCNAVNFAPADVGDRVKQGTCEFQFCDQRAPSFTYGEDGYQSYLFNGEMLLSTTPPPTRPAPPTTSTTYDRNGWRQVGNVRDLALNCRQLNAGRGYDPRDGPKYGVKYPDGVETCKTACATKVVGCDAVNYAKDGQCQFQQCNGRDTRDRTIRGFDMWLYKPLTTVNPHRRSPTGCKTTCTKGFTCDELIDRHDQTCQNLELTFRKCSCAGCSCPAPWKQVRNISQASLDCEHLNTRRGSEPMYNTDFRSLDQCQKACTDRVPGCNAVNYAPAAVGRRTLKGTCQFNYCNRAYGLRFSGGKFFNSYIYSGPKVRATGPAPTRPTRAPIVTTRGSGGGESRVWTLLRTVTQTKLECEHLNTGRADKPLYNTIYSTLASCKDACQNKVPDCNAINYAPAAVPGHRLEKGKCQFQFCDPRYTPTSYPYSRASKDFQSYLFNGVPLRDMRTTRRATAAPTYDRNGWRRVGAIADLDLGCKKINAGPGYDKKNGPAYDSTFDTVDKCKAACKFQVAGCDAINYDDRSKKCQFQQCNGKIIAGTNKFYDSYFLKPQTTTTLPGCKSTCIGPQTCDELMAQQGSTCAQVERLFDKCDCTGCLCLDLWQHAHNVTQVKLDCEHLNTKHKSKPHYNTIYDTAQKCQKACTDEVPGCNAVNYSPADASKIKKGKCEFQYCDPEYEPRFFGTKHFDAYLYNGPPFVPTTTTTTPASTTSTTYGPDGWRQVGTKSEVELGCTKLNAGKDHDIAKGPRYDTHYDSLDKCKAACKDQVAGCDAINYSKDKDGKCQFQQCKGVVARGKVRDFESYLFKRSTKVTTTTKSTVCRKTCLGGSFTCDDIVKLRRVTCASIQGTEGCDCSGCLCPTPPTTTTTATTATATTATITTTKPTRPKLNPVATIPPVTTPSGGIGGADDTNKCAKDIDCTGKCGGSAKVDACGHCGGRGTCSSYSQGDVLNKLKNVFPADSTVTAVNAVKAYLSRTKAIFRSKDIVPSGNSVTLNVRIVGYTKATFSKADIKHFKNFCNAMTAVALSKITVTDITDAPPPSRRRRLKPVIDGAVDIIVQLDVSGIHPSNVAQPAPPSRTPVVVGIVVAILIAAAVLVAGVLIVYKVLDNKKKMMEAKRQPLEMEMTDYSPKRKTNEYIQSSEPVLGEENLARRGSKATVIVTSP